MDFSQLKKLTIGGIELKQLFIDGIQIWKAISYINQIPVSTDASGAIYNGKGYKEKTYINNGVEGSNSTTDSTGFIPCKVGDIIRMKNMPFSSTVAQCRISFFKSDKTFIGQVLVSSSWYMDTKFIGVKDSNGNYTELTITNVSGITANCAFVRITAIDITADSVVTINQEIN